MQGGHSEVYCSRSNLFFYHFKVENVVDDVEMHQVPATVQEETRIPNAISSGPSSPSPGRTDLDSKRKGFPILGDQQLSDYDSIY